MRARHRAAAASLAGLIVLGTAGIGSAASTHHAHHAPTHKAKTPAIGAEDVTSTATAVRVPFYSHTGEDVEGELPYATAMLASGAGQGLSSILWPGETGANAGSVLQLLNITQVPTSVSQQLNDPEKAEAQTGVGQSTVSKSEPGVIQTATAKAKYVAATAKSSASALPKVGKDFGATSATTVVRVTNKAVITTARSTVHDLDIDKVVKIGAVTSVARGLTRGRSASGTTRTTVSNATVAGIKVAITASGVHVTQKPKAGAPLPGGLGSILGKAPLPAKLPSLDSLVNKALKQSGISLHLTKSSKKVHKSHVSLDSGALVVGLANKNYTSQDNDTANALILGGATLDADSAPGFPPVHIKPIKPIKTTTGGSHGIAGGTSGTPGTPGTAGTTTPGSSSPQVASNPSSTGELASASAQLFDGLKGWWIVLAGLGAALIAFGLRQLPDRVLEAPGAACRLEDV